MDSYEWGYKSSNMGYEYSYPTYNPILYPAMKLQVLGLRMKIFEKHIEPKQRSSGFLG